MVSRERSGAPWVRNVDLETAGLAENWGVRGMGVYARDRGHREHQECVQETGKAKAAAFASGPGKEEEASSWGGLLPQCAASRGVLADVGSRGHSLEEGWLQGS